jgi:hypothetical protein
MLTANYNVAIGFGPFDDIYKLDTIKNILGSHTESARRISSCKIEVTMQNSGSNGFFPLAPAIDYKYQFVITQKRDRITIAMKGAHDGFPAYEVFAQGTLLYGYTPELTNESPWALLGDSDIAAERVAFRIPGAPCGCDTE